MSDLRGFCLGQAQARTARSPGAFSSRLLIDPLAVMRCG